MPTLRKAARGKRRWVGVEIDRKNIDEDTLLEEITPDAGKPRIAWISDDGCYVILEVRLENHKKLVDTIKNLNHAKSVTSSGKIRLVKSRIFQLYKSP